MQSEELYSTPFYRVTKRTFTNSDRLVIAFDSWQQIPDIAKPCQGENYLSSRNINHITIKCGRNTWYQDEEFSGVIHAIRQAGAGFHLIGYGASMGGYAAISFYECLGLADAISFCPQFSIDSTKVPFETRWRKEAGDLVFRNDFASGTPVARKATVIYDPFHKLDSAHCALIAQYHPGIRLFRLPFCGHNPQEYLRALRPGGLLPEFVEALLTDQFEPEMYRKRIRVLRGSAGRYWVNMSSSCLSKRPELALKAALNATKCANAGEYEKKWYEKVLGKV